MRASRCLHPPVDFVKHPTNCNPLDFEVQSKKLSRWFWDSNHQIKDADFKAQIGKSYTTGFEAKPKEIVTTGFEDKPEKTVSVILRSNHWQTVLLVLRLNHW
jgi:hypothetical protein